MWGNIARDKKTKIHFMSCSGSCVSYQFVTHYTSSRKMEWHSNISSHFIIKNEYAHINNMRNANADKSINTL
jgi:hypothetical protein